MFMSLNVNMGFLSLGVYSKTMERRTFFSGNQSATGSQIEDTSEKTG